MRALLAVLVLLVVACKVEQTPTDELGTGLAPEPTDGGASKPPAVPESYTPDHPEDSWSAIPNLVIPNPPYFDARLYVDERRPATAWTGTELLALAHRDVWPEGSGTQVFVSYRPATGAVRMLDTAAPATLRSSAGFVQRWHEDQWLVWGRLSFHGPFSSKARLGEAGSIFDPALGTWRPVAGSELTDTERSTFDPPGEGTVLHALPDGLLVLGVRCTIHGELGEVTLDCPPHPVGRRYSLESDSWREFALEGAPLGRAHESLVSGLTDSAVVLWQLDGASARVDVARETWTPISSPAWVTAPAGMKLKNEHPGTGVAAVWSGSELIFWGSITAEDPVDPTRNRWVAVAGRYNPTDDTWRPINPVGAPSLRKDHVAVWTGRELIVWGGRGAAGETLRDGARYDPGSQTWTALPLEGAPRLVSPSGVWSGQELFVWGDNADYDGWYDVEHVLGYRYRPPAAP